MTVPVRVVMYTDATVRGGAEQVVADLVGALDAGHDVTVLGVDRTVVDWVARARAGVEARAIPAVRSKRDVRGLLDHVRTIRALRPDIFQANLYEPWACQFGIAAALAIPGVRVVALEHLPVPTASELQRRLKQLTSRGLAAHVTVGHRTARELEQIVGLPAGSVRVIHNGVAPLPRRSRGADASGPRVVGALGRLTDQKGYDILIRAMVELPDTRAVIVGDGPARSELERLRDELGLRDRVALPGSVEDPGQALGGFDALALPSRFEAFPLVVLEAMHAGLPVVAADVGSVSEAVVDGETGMLVPADDPARLATALRQVLDPAAGPAMGERGLERALALFTRERMVGEYAALYRSLLGV